MSLNDTEWFTEIHSGTSAYSVRYTEKLLEKHSRFQKIQVFQTERMGRVLVLDGCFMLTDLDAFIYHEMILHTPLAVIPDPKRVLVIGGGDGGVVTEAVKYPLLESITLCEIDADVVSACRELFPDISAGLDDPRVRVLNEDGAAFVAQFEAAFDLVVVDSTDPVGPGTTLFETAFYQSVKRSLKPDGVAVFQTESPLFMKNVFADVMRKLSSVHGAGHVFPYLITMPCYPGGLWSLTFCSPTRHPLRDLPEGIHPDLNAALRYYTRSLHRGAFALPAFMEKIIAESVS